METIAHRVMYLYRHRQQHFPILLVVFSKREHRGKEVLHVRNVHRKVRKRHPGNRRYEKDIFPGLFFRPIRKVIAIARNIFCIGVLEVMNIAVEVTPQSRKGLCFRVENGIAGMNFIPYDKLIVLHGHTEFRMSVHDFREEENNRWVKLPADLFDMFSQRGDVDQNRLVNCTLSK